MGNLSEIVCKNTFKYQKKIKKICEPLVQGLGVDSFWHWNLTDKGELTFISSDPEVSDFFYSNELYKGHPYFRAPKCIPSGFIFSEKTADEEYAQSQGKVKDRYSLDQLFMIMNSDGKKLEGYGFATTQDLPDLTNTYLSNLFLLRKFITYFHKETEDIIKWKDDCTVNIANEIGDTFYKPTIHFNSIESTGDLSSLMKIVSPFQFEALNTLSSREKDCIKWLLKGRSASQIGKALHLSPRTVEFYLNNIKCKLSCQNKKELFDCLLGWKDTLNFLFFD